MIPDTNAGGNIATPIKKGQPGTTGFAKNLREATPRIIEPFHVWQHLNSFPSSY